MSCAGRYDSGAFHQEAQYRAAQGIRVSESSLTIDESGEIDLNLWNSDVRDLSPLRGVPITQLWLPECRGLRSIEPLRGMALRQLSLRGTRVSDLSPLAGMPLQHLDISSTPVSDLTPLRGLPLRTLDLSGCTRVHDMTSLEGMAVRVCGGETEGMSSQPAVKAGGSP